MKELMPNLSHTEMGLFAAGLILLLAVLVGLLTKQSGCTRRCNQGRSCTCKGDKANS